MWNPSVQATVMRQSDKGGTRTSPKGCLAKTTTSVALWSILLATAATTTAVSAFVNLATTTTSPGLSLATSDTRRAFVKTTKTTTWTPTTTTGPNGYTATRLANAAAAARKTTMLERTDEERMTEEDEALLFGDDNESDSIGGAISYSSTSTTTIIPRRKKTRAGNIMPDWTQTLNPLDHSRTNPLINKLHTMRNTIQSCPELWTELALHCPDKRALYDEHLSSDDDTVVDLTFGQMHEAVLRSAAVFQDLGIGQGKNVAVLAENSAVWLQIDHGIQKVGGASAVRGADAPLDELRYIYEHSDSAAVVVLQGPKLLQKLLQQQDAAARQKMSSSAAPLGLHNDSHGPVKTVLLMHREKKSNAQIQEMAAAAGVEVFLFSDLQRRVKDWKSRTFPTITSADLSTIVYTSGTTGHPKGVMLSHGNLIHQWSHRLAPTKPYEESEPLPGETMVSLLPVWHITERSFELWMASRGCSVVYSTIRTFKNDLAKHRPQWMVLVPRVLEKIAVGVQEKFATGSVPVKILSQFFTAVGMQYKKHANIVAGLVVGNETPGALEKLASTIAVAALTPFHAVGNKLVWSKVQDGFGGRLKVIISGGSALAGGLETFYETAGFTVCVGYGLTECAPLISYRRSDSNLVTAGCTGMACIDTQLRVVDPDSKAVTVPRPALPHGQVGVVLAKGPQVMKGYYKNKEATDKAIDKFGWFDTGDLGRVNPATGDLILTGRAKDTIVLSNGENVEPQPIEDAIVSSCPLIEQVMLTGQDGRKLTAIAVLNINELYLGGFLTEEHAKELQAASDKVNDPKCKMSACTENVSILNDAAAVHLRCNKDLAAALVTAVKGATKHFRKWEQVADVYLTLEPFAMINGQLTQSYKVKRAAVYERYLKELAP